MAKLPDAEKLCEQLAAELRPLIGPRSAMVGLYTGGVWLAERLHKLLGMKTPLGLMDIAFYRDDYAARGLHHDPKRTTIRNAPRFPSTSTAGISCWSTTSFIPAARCAPR